MTIVEEKTQTVSNQKTKTISIKVCMGSACFAGGNAANLDFIENFVREHGLKAKIYTFGSRCEGNCNSGPNVFINGERIESASPVRLESILRSFL